jgi:hypothetical protein
MLYLWLKDFGVILGRSLTASGYRFLHTVPVEELMEDVASCVEASVLEVSWLTGKDRDVVQAYTDQDFCEWVNQNLYMGAGTFANDVNYTTDVQCFSEIVQTLDGVLDGHCNDARILYRGVSSTHFLTSMKGKGKDIIIGSQVSFKHYLSTSTNPSVALEFIDSAGYMCEIFTTKGLNISSLSDLPDETEVLLPRGTVFTITKIREATTECGMPLTVFTLHES